MAKGIFNIDWFSFTADFENYDDEANMQLRNLFTLLDEQRSKSEEEGTFLDLGLFKFEVLNHGTRNYYYILHNDDLQIKFARYRAKTEATFPVYVHFKSQFLWSEIFSLTKLEDKFKLILDWLSDVIGGSYKRSKINRIDLCYHTDEIPAGFTADYFVGRHTLDTTRRTHRILTGVDIGSRKTQKLFLRCYNKFIECRASKKLWFFDIWFHAGLDIRKVWNIEFEIHREFFTEKDATRGVRRFGGKQLDSAEDVLATMPSIWWYLTNEWVSYRIPDNDRPTRWSFHPWWLELSNFHECTDKISRIKQMELPTLEAIIPPLRGYLSTYAARKGGVLDDGTLYRQLFNDLIEYDKRKERDFEETVEIKKKLLDPEGN